MICLRNISPFSNAKTLDYFFDNRAFVNFYKLIYFNNMPFGIQIPYNNEIHFSIYAFCSH
jgi:hypothetical protein